MTLCLSLSVNLSPSMSLCLSVYDSADVSLSLSLHLSLTRRQRHLLFVGSFLLPFESEEASRPRGRWIEIRSKRIDRSFHFQPRWPRGEKRRKRREPDGWRSLRSLPRGPIRNEHLEVRDDRVPMRARIRSITWASQLLVHPYGGREGYAYGRVGTWMEFVLRDSVRFVRRPHDADDSDERNTHKATLFWLLHPFRWRRGWKRNILSSIRSIVP